MEPDFSLNGSQITSFLSSPCCQAVSYFHTKPGSEMGTRACKVSGPERAILLKSPCVTAAPLDRDRHSLLAAAARGVFLAEETSRVVTVT